MLAGQMVKAQTEKGILWSFAAEEGFLFCDSCSAFSCDCP